MKNNQKLVQILTASLAMSNFFGKAKYDGKRMRSFKGYPGIARQKGKAKRKAKLRALAIINLHPNDRFSRNQKAFEKAKAKQLGGGLLKFIRFNGKNVKLK